MAKSKPRKSAKKRKAPAQRKAAKKRKSPKPRTSTKGTKKQTTKAAAAGTLATKHAGRYWKLGALPAEIITDGRTLDFAVPEDLPKGARLRIEVPASLKTALAASGAALPIRSPTIDNGRGPITKAKEGPVPFESFDYADEAVTKQVYIEHQGWRAVPSLLHPGTLENVVATRVLQGVEALATGHPVPPPGEYVERASGHGPMLTNTNRPGG